ncbi:MAG TPA: ribose-phosphate pyrophosphokinase, partial [Labilithrix sp.]|nr:ribose-phosphate pyrophosphokinase [Labilithrix sp.]
MARAVLPSRLMTPSAEDSSSRTLAELVVLAGSANPALAASLARELGLALGESTVERFPDGELHVEVAALGIRGMDVVMVQPTSNLASNHLLELLLMADACRRSGARSVSAVIPYFGYARQDRRKKDGEPIGIRVVAQILATARFERIITVDLHSDVTEAAIDVPVEHLSAVPLLANALEKQTGPDSVVVAPDFGAVRLARQYAHLLRLPLAVVHKVRRSGTRVDIEGVAGDVQGLRPIFVDDMVATGATIVTAARAPGRGGQGRSRRRGDPRSTHAGRAGSPSRGGTPLASGHRHDRNAFARANRHGRLGGAAARCPCEPRAFTHRARPLNVSSLGLALLRAADAVEREEQACEGDERSGLRVLRHALEIPSR